MLNPAQKEAVEHAGGPLLILAGAGAGKTHTLTERIAWLIERENVYPGSILAVTFTNKAAKEMRERVFKRLGLSLEGYSPYRSFDVPLIGTFHSIGMIFLRRFSGLVGLSQTFTLYDEDDRQKTIRDILKASSQENVNAREILSAISRAKNEGRLPDESTMRRGAGIDDLPRIYREYEKRLRESDAVDFDDILLLTLRVLEFPEAREYFQNRFAHILVDEYQDTNDIQYKIVRILAEKSRNLCVVGDDWQGIYSWRGANIKNILSFERDFPDARVVKLEQNYRSTKTIISAANAVVKRNSSSLEKTLWTENPAGEKIEIYDLASERDEARKIVDLIRESGKSYWSWAILYRTNGQSRQIEESLMRSNIPYRIFGGVKFYERKEVKDLLAYMRLIANPRDRASLERVINVPSRKLGDKSVATILDYLAQYRITVFELVDMIDDMDDLATAARNGFRAFVSVLSAARAVIETGGSPDMAMRTVIKESRYIESLEGAHTSDEILAKRENIDEFVTLASRYIGMDAKEGFGLFLEEIGLMTDQDRNEAGDRVALMTIHLSKGLEFENVLIAGAEEGIFPHSRSLPTSGGEYGSTGNDEGMQEERRLMYVAMTRAKKRLYITRSRERFTFGNYSMNPPSRFIDEIPPEYAQVESVGFSGTSSASTRPSYGASPYAAKASSSPIRALGRARNDAGAFSLGQSVEHPQFGIGRIVALDASIAQIAFGGGYGIKKLNIEIAPIKPL